jgi:hypothetical protein
MFNKKYRIMYNYSPTKIFIDLKGGIKINDPDFSEGALSF